MCGCKGPTNVQLYEPRSLVEINVLQTIDSVLNKPFWWSQWIHPNVQEAWIQDALTDYVRYALCEVLDGRPESNTFDSYMQPLLQELLANAVSEERRDSLLAEHITSIRLQLPCDDEYGSEDESDSGDDAVGIAARGRKKSICD